MSNIIDKIRISGVTYTLQGSGGGGGGTVESAITSGSTNAVESKAIYDATHIDSFDLWTATDRNNYNNNTQSLYKVYVQYTGDTALDEQVQVEIYYGSNFTREAITGNVYQETASTSSVFTSTFDNGKWIIESLSPNYIVNIYSDYRFRIWTYDRTVGGDFAADVIKDDIIPYIGDVETVANNAIVTGSFVQGDNNREIAIRLQRGNGGSVTSFLRLDDLKYAQDVLSTDIQFPTGEVGWSEITPETNCVAGNMPTNKVKVTYSGQTVSAQYRTIRFDAIFRITSTYQQQYRTWINWTDTTTPTVDGCSAVTATYDSTDDSVTIELPSGETTYNGYTGTFSIEGLRSNYCQFGSGISSVKYYGDITEDIYTVIAHKQDTLSAGTGISISGNVISATGGGGGNPTVELTQAEYDALVTAGTVSADTYYIITDAQAGDLTQYWTSAQTQSAINQATSGKVDTSAITSSVTSASTDSEIPTAKAVYDAIPQGGGGGGTVSSAITSGDTNAVAGGAVYDAVVYSANTYTTELTFDADEYAENWIVGQSAITIDVSGYTSDTIADYAFQDGAGNPLGNANIFKLIDYWQSSWSNNAHNCTITTDGDTATTAIITDIPSGTVKIRRMSAINPPKAIISGDTPATWIKDALDDHRDNTTVHITAGERTSWNNKSNFSGSYNDLTDKPIPDSALNVASTNPVQNQALYSELRIDNESGETETTLTFEDYNTTNYPNGCTKIKVQDITSNSMNNIKFFDDDQPLGYIIVSNWGSISVDNDFQGATYEISGSTVIISYPTATTVNRLDVTGLDVSDNPRYTYKAITSSTTPLKNQVVANTTALGGLSLIKLTESEYTALVTKDSNTLYVVVPDPSN